MKKLIIVLIFLMIAILMTLTRPDKEQHKEAMLKAIEEYVDEEAKNRLGDNVLAKIGRDVVVKTAETALNSKLRENNYYLFNTTFVHLQGKDNTLSVGLFGMVLTFDKEMIREKLEEALETKEAEKTEREVAKQSAKELKRLQKEQRKREKELAKEEKRKAKEAAKEAKRKQKEAEKEAKRKAKEAQKKE
jgi:outer membrane biosynthesis protein TonB